MAEKSLWLMLYTLFTCADMAFKTFSPSDCTATSGEAALFGFGLTCRCSKCVYLLILSPHSPVADN